MPRLGSLLFLRPCGDPVRRERHEQRPHNAELDTAEKLCFPALWQNWQMSARSLTGLILEPDRFARDFARSVWWVWALTRSARTGQRANTPTSKVEPTVLPPPAGATCPNKRPF